MKIVVAVKEGRMSMGHSSMFVERERFFIESNDCPGQLDVNRF
jgi:hypothetical protein